MTSVWAVSLQVTWLKIQQQVDITFHQMQSVTTLVWPVPNYTAC